MPDDANLDELFRQAVSLIDAGNAESLRHLIAQHPRIVSERLTTPGSWLSDQVGGALEGFFKDPYLLWFVAEDPVRIGKLPGNMADIARVIIEAVPQSDVDILKEQVEYALRLVCWSWIARDCGVQLALIDLLLNTGADPNGCDVYGGRYGTHADSAIYNKNFAAAELLLQRGARPTLTTALCLGRWDEMQRLAAVASLEERQDAFVQAALNGQAEALRRMLELGFDATTVSQRNQSHGTALHHAVYSGCLDAVRVLVKAGANLDRRDTVYDGTPLGWAKYCVQESSDAATKQRYDKIAAYLIERGAK